MPFFKMCPNITFKSFIQLLILNLLVTIPVQADFQAGASRKTIVPPIPSYMGGFFDRKEKFKGVHDEVFVRAIYMENGKNRMILISSDLTAIAGELTIKIRSRLEKELGMAGHQIMVSCAHNHSAPSLYEPGRMKKGESAVLNFFATQFSEAAMEAYRSRKPAKAGFRAGHITGLTSNRQQHNDLIDPQVGILRIEERDSRKIIGTLFNFTGHPVIVGSKNLFLSGEYPGVAARTVENILGGVALFTQGAAGDVTMKRHGDPFEEIERIGRILAGEVIKESGFVEFQTDPVLQSSNQVITCPSRIIPPIDQTTIKINKLKARIETAEKQKASSNLIRSLKQKMQVLDLDKLIAEKVKANEFEWKDSYEAEIQTMRIGNLAIIAIPGEIFVEYALESRSRVKQLTGMNMILSGYTNDYVGYLITPRAKETGGYEAGISRVRSDSARRMIESAVKQILDFSEKK
jgi:Neutral/alkaline non-lysosomal ceramidase, N-terminal